MPLAVQQHGSAERVGAGASLRAPGYANVYYGGQPFKQQQHTGAPPRAPPMRARTQRRRGCTRCVDCSGLSSHYHSCSSRSEEFGDWWPCGLQSPTTYFYLRQRTLEQAFRVQADREGIFRAASETTEGTPSAIRTTRGLRALTVQVPAAYTNIQQNNVTVRYLGALNVELVPRTQRVAKEDQGHQGQRQEQQQAAQVPQQQQAERQAGQHELLHSRADPVQTQAAAAVVAASLQHKPSLLRTLSGTRRRISPSALDRGSSSGSSSAPPSVAVASEVKRSRTTELPSGHFIAMSPLPEQQKGLSPAEAQVPLPSGPSDLSTASLFPTPLPPQAPACPSIGSSFSSQGRALTPIPFVPTPQAAPTPHIISIPYSGPSAWASFQGAEQAGGSSGSSYYRRQLRIKEEKAYPVHQVVDLSQEGTGPREEPSFASDMWDIFGRPLRFAQNLAASVSRKLSPSY